MSVANDFLVPLFDLNHDNRNNSYREILGLAD